MRNLGQNSDSGPARGIGANTENEAIAGDEASEANDRLLDHLERWEEHFLAKNNDAIESVGIDDPELREALQERIDAQKQLYEFLGLVERPTGAAICDDPNASRIAPAPEPRSMGPEPANDPPMIGRYRVKRAIGQGSYGRVYLGYDSELDRLVAIKVPIAGRASFLLDVEGYLSEARMLARLSHPNIVPVYDVGRTEDGLCYVVSRYMDGGDLASRLASGSYSFGESAGLVAALAEALHYAHTQDLFHRDVKPANILMDAKGVPALADFGLALSKENFGKGAGVVGTTAYMSPEQARGEGHLVDGRSDIFSLAIVLYELLAGRRPFRGKSREELMQNIVNHEPRPPRQIDDSIPRELERICLKGLARRAAERYSTALDFAEDLRYFLHARPLGVATDGVRLAPAVHAVTPPPAPTLPDRLAAADLPNCSSRQSAKIVPKGLCSFDENDAEFFLGLLPGPRDRYGLPDGLRFWKTRVETTDPDKTFRVGIIYGPSGCGKSSLVRAGLLPLLGGHVTPLYVEASGWETEDRLLRSVRKTFPRLPASSDLVETLSAIRLGKVLPTACKVFIVLDQFEQWLFTRRPDDDKELILALRQCDGEHLQALCLIRDDFWMATTRFMKDLEIDLTPHRNIASVDLFDQKHARKVLAAYGSAYETLPAGADKLTREHGAFLEKAVAALAEESKIVPVRLALFAELIKTKPWTPATLYEIGGMEGVGMKFLEETFNSSRSSPKHRFHQKAAQAVLKSLLPEMNSDIKGRMRSIAELQVLSGYGDRPGDFDDLLRTLDNELRLITPVDVEEATEARSTAVHAPNLRYYQLTHDYLVHSLRDWLTQKQRATRKGRAELLLAERSAFWSLKTENRHLPSLREWSTIRALTRRTDWTDPQRLMMRRGGRVHRARVATALLLIGLTTAAITVYNAKTRTNFLLAALPHTKVEKIPGVLDQLAAYPRWTYSNRLRDLASQNGNDLRSQLGYSLALVPEDPGQLDYLYTRLLSADATELPVLLDVLERHRLALIPRLWHDLEAAEPGSPRLLTAAGGLARFDPDGPTWTAAGSKVAHAMVGVSNVFLGAWVDTLRLVRARLKSSLAEVFRDTGRSVSERSMAADILVEYAGDDAGMLAELVMDASPKDFASLFPVAARHASQVTDVWLRTLENASSSGDQKARSDAAKDRNAARSARAAIALLRTSKPESVWPQLRHSADPRVRSFIVNWLRPFSADPRVIVSELDRLLSIRPLSSIAGLELADTNLFDRDLSALRAMILALGTYDPESLALQVRERLTARLRELYRADPDAGIHGAAEWTLRRWKQAKLLEEIDSGMRGATQDGRGWFVNTQGQTFVVVGDHFVVTMGSPPDEQGHRPQELLHRHLIHRRFALANKELTVEQFQKFLDQQPRIAQREHDDHSPDAAGPKNAITWYEAAAYCNWLSRQERLSEVYEPNAKGEFAEGMKIKKEALTLSGYRLPTEPEWEHMCRAGAATSRYYGNSLEVLGNYVWYIGNSGDRARPCGLLFPNDLGMFDMLGNVYEWCQGRAIDYQPDGSGTMLDELHEMEIVLSSNSRVIRGGSFGDRLEDSRSGQRDRESPGNRYMTYGFRPARTIR